MTKLVVADSRPIISFSRAKKLHIIQQVLERVFLPFQVHYEVVINGEGKPGSEEIKNATWITIEKVRNQFAVRSLKDRFGDGESEAIVLAQELAAILLANEWGVMKEARKQGIEVVSTNLILIEAKKKHLIRSVKEVLDALVATGFRTTTQLISETLQKAGEEIDPYLR